MRTRVLPAGDAALLVEVGGVDDVLVLTAALGGLMAVGEGPGGDERADAGGGATARIVALVPAATTVLILTAPGGDLGELGAVIGRIAETLDPGEPPAAHAAEVRLAVCYDGPDLDAVAELTGLSRSEVVARHTASPWRAAFGGFAPGFAYLVGGDPALDVPRRRESRTAVPTGAVALAGGYSAVYPAESPGGWQLIGTTDIRLWDVDRDPPALIGPGSLVRFVDATPPAHPTPGADPTAGADPTPGHDPTPAEDLTDKTAPTDGGADVSARVAPVDGSTAAGSAGSGARTHFEVVRAGPLSLFQDAGRPGHAAIGVGTSGAADRSSYLSANRLVGNDQDAPTIECLLGGLTMRIADDVVVAVTGAQVPVTVDGEPADFGAPLRLDAGQLVKLGTPKQGLRTYLAVRNGFDVPSVLGSCSTDTLSGVGPPPIARGDRIGVLKPPGSHADLDQAHDLPAHGGADARGNQNPAPMGTLTLRVIAGPRDDWFTSPSDLAVGHWVVSPNSNRIGVRLDRPADAPDGAAPSLQRSDSRELPSEGVTLGAIQVPPSGQPVLFLADHPVTGGYPVIAVVVTGDVDRAAQARPGQRIRFAFVPPDGADPRPPR